MLTQTVVSFRILGKSEAPDMLTSCFVAVTGNNLVIKGDLIRRTIMCRLDAKVERPASRVFEWDPLEVAKARRGELVAAALTILRAYHVAGMPSEPPALGSFEAWSARVRGALMWIGAADPLDSMSELRESDPVIDEMRLVMTRWSAAIGPDAVTAQEIIQRANETLEADGKKHFIRPELREALLTVAANQSGVLHARRLGKWLQGKKDRIVSNLRIMKASNYQGVAKWAICDA